MSKQFHPVLPPGFTMMVMNGITSIRSPEGWLLRFPSDIGRTEASHRYRTFLMLNGITDEHFMPPARVKSATAPYVIEIGGRKAEGFSIRTDRYGLN